VARLRGYPAWPAVYAAGFGAAAAVGYLRIAADEHWLSDVVAAAAVGAGLGVAVPLLFHGEEKLTLTPLPSGVVGLQISGSL
jgi:membrane-associated phospholipid phosphatase